MLAAATVAEQMHSHSRCVPMIEKSSRNKEGAKVAKRTERMRIVCAENMPLNSTSFILLVTQIVGAVKN